MSRNKIRWTPELETWLAGQCQTSLDENRTPDYGALAKGLGITADAVRMRWYRIRDHGMSEEKPEMPHAEPPARVVESTIPDVRDYLDIPPRPFAVPVPRTGKLKKRRLKTAVHWTDTHFPYQDDRVLDVIAAIIRALQPDVLIHGGDLVDCYAISRFSKDPNRLHSLQDEIDLARTHLHQMAQLAPDAEKWLLEGNHEDRLRRTIWDLPGGAAELARLTKFQEAMSWPVLLGLDEIGWRFVPAKDQTRTSIIPKLITKHGTMVRKFSGYTARGEWEKYGRGGISGHTHRMGGFYHRDHNGAVCWWEGGCTCDLNPDYVMDPDWQNGCLVITWDESDGRFAVEPVFIMDGEAIYRGERLAA